jgi:hypothetical protein
MLRHRVLEGDAMDSPCPNVRNQTDLHVRFRLQIITNYQLLERETESALIPKIAGCLLG